MSGPDSCLRCTHQPCRHFGKVVPAGQGFTCGFGHLCSVLHPPPPVPFWHRRGFKGLVATLTIIMVASSLLAARAILLDQARPRIEAQFDSGTVDRGTVWTARVKVSGTPPFSCQWFRGVVGDIAAPVDEEQSEVISIVTSQPKELYWVRIANEHGSVDSTQFVAQSAYVVDIDYERELSEAYGSARVMIDKSAAVRVFDEQLDEAFAEIEGASRTQWERLRSKAIEDRQAEAVRLQDKLRHLAELDRDKVAEIIDRQQAAGRGVEARRQQLALSLLREGWLAACTGGSMDARSLIEDAGKLSKAY